MDSAGNLYVAGMTNAGTPTNFHSLVVRYRVQNPWLYHWSMLYAGTGHDEARDVSVSIFGSPLKINVYPCGASFMTGQGLDGVSIRYRDNTLP